MRKTLKSMFQLNVKEKPHSALSNNNSLETYLNFELTSRSTCQGHFNFSTGKSVFLHPTFIERDLIVHLYSHAIVCFSGLHTLVTT